MFQLHTFPNFHVSGLATTSLTLYNMFGILTNHPEVQDQAFHEIQTVLGNRTPTLQDKPHLPICEAVSCKEFSIEGLFQLKPLVCNITLKTLTKLLEKLKLKINNTFYLKISYL